MRLGGEADVINDVGVWAAVAGVLGAGVWGGHRVWRKRTARITVNAVSESWIAHQRGRD